MIEQPSPESDKGEYVVLKRLIASSATMDSARLSKSYDEGKITLEQFKELAQDLFKRYEHSMDGLADTGIAQQKTIDELGIDPITGLKKLDSLAPELKALITELNFKPDTESKARHPKLYSLMVVALDIDNLRAFNNEKGHPVGDRALRTWADSIKKAVRDGDLVFRRGDKSDEFIVILRNEQEMDEEKIASAFSHIKNAANQSFIQIEGEKFPVTAAAGYVLVKPGDSRTPEKILAYADASQLQEKEDSVKKRRIEEALSRLK